MNIAATGTVLLATLASCAVEAVGYDHAVEVAVLGGGKADDPMPRKTWTFLIYGAADNDLAPYIHDDINELEAIGSTEDVNFLAFLDTPSGASVHYLLADDDAAALHSPTASWGAVDSGDWQTLRRAATWALETYPAERYAVVVSGHGGGTPRVIAPDAATGSAISVSDLSVALDEIMRTSGTTLEVFGADACLMQTLEVTAQLRYDARVVVASENTEPGPGWDYTAIGGALAAAPQETWGYQLGGAMVEHYRAYYAGLDRSATLAALSSSSLFRPPSSSEGQLNLNAMNQLARLTPLLRAHAETPAGREELRGIARATFRVSPGDAYADAIDLAGLLAERTSASPIRSAAAELRDTLRNEVRFAYWVDEAIAGRASGLSIYLPASAPSADELTAYEAEYWFAQTLDWDGLVRAIYAP